MSENLAIICIVEQSYLPFKRASESLGIPLTTIYRWCDGYIAIGESGRED